MPYKSKAQMRKFFAMQSRGELPKGTAEEWAHHTKSIKALPEHVANKKAAGLLWYTLVKLSCMVPKEARSRISGVARAISAGMTLKSAFDVTYPEMPAEGRLSLQDRVIKLAAIEAPAYFKAPTEKRAGLASAVGSLTGASPATTYPVDSTIGGAVGGGLAGGGVGLAYTLDHLKHSDPGLIRNALAHTAVSSAAGAGMRVPSIARAMSPMGSLLGNLLRRRGVAIPAAIGAGVGGLVGMVDGRNTVKQLQQG